MDEARVSHWRNQTLQTLEFLGHVFYFNLYALIIFDFLNKVNRFQDRGHQADVEEKRV